MQAIKKGRRRHNGMVQLSERIPANTTETASATLPRMITTPMNLGPTPITSVQKGVKYTLATREAHEMALPKHDNVAILTLPINSGCMGAAVAAVGNPSGSHDGGAALTAADGSAWYVGAAR
jgi:hypothetical protein